MPADSGKDQSVGAQPVSRLATRDVVICRPDTPVVMAAQRMRAARCSSIIVVEEQQPVGIWTEHDGLKLDLSDISQFDQPISEVMSRPVAAINQDASVAVAADLMRNQGMRHLVVVSEIGELSGVLSQSDLVHHQGVEAFLVLKALGEAVSADFLTVSPDLPVPDLARLMRRRRQNAVVVSAPSGVPHVGIVTERDVMSYIASRRQGGVVEDIANRPAISLHESDSLLQGRNVMLSEGVRHLVVLSSREQVVGLLSFSDIMETFQLDFGEHLASLLKERDVAVASSVRDRELAKKIIDGSREAILITDSQGVIEFVNPSFTRITGYTLDEVVGKNPSFLQSGQHDETFFREMWHGLMREGIWQGEIWHRRKNGVVYPEWLTITAIHGRHKDATQFVGVFTDISERKRDEALIRRMSYYDALTGLPNRRLFSGRLTNALARARENEEGVAVFHLDVDSFKLVNSSFGQEEGDRTLQVIADRLDAVLEQEGCLARINGDEFAILIHVSNEMDAAAAAERIFACFAEPIIANEVPIYLTASIGIALAPEDGNTAEDLLSHADTALSRAKDSGRNRFSFYTPAMSLRSMQRLALDGELRDGFKRDELFLVFQPKVDAKTGTLLGWEALVRWSHPKRGLVPPADFISLCEETGFIEELGHWVLCKACQYLSHWLQEGLEPGRMAVNVSPRQFHAGDLPKRIEAALKDAGLQGAMLELEITEGLLMTDLDDAAAMLAKVSDSGVGIAIDDFGTGFSSLKYLKRLPIDCLKIDRSFITDMFSSEEDEELVETIVMLAQKLKLQSVAEGVETEAQRDFLRDRGCDVLQGYLTGRPMTADAAYEFMLACKAKQKDPTCAS